MPRDLLEVKDRMLHNGVYFCANYATWHYLALLGTIWQHWATKCHESSPLSSEPGPPASYCIIWFLYCAILRFPVFPCLSLFSLESTRLPPVSSCVFFSLECNGSRWFCCKLPYFSVCSPTFGPCCWAPPFAESPMPCCRLKDQWKTKFHQVTESYPKGQRRDRDSRYQGRNTVTECN